MDISIDPDFLRVLIVQVRALMAKVPADVGEDGSNSTDDTRMANGVDAVTAGGLGLCFLRPLRKNSGSRSR